MSATGVPGAANRLGRFWAERTRRERVLLVVAGAVLLLALLVGLAVRPALRALQDAPEARTHLQLQRQQMEALQAQSAALQKQPRRRYDEAQLRASLAPLGEGARLNVEAGRAQLSLQAAPPEALAGWLLRAREQAGVVVRQAQLRPVQQGGRTLWGGQLTLELDRR